MSCFCIQCGFNIPYEVYEYSVNHFGHPLCRNDQDWIRNMLWDEYTTQQTIDLYLALKAHDISVEIEKYDGYKHIDIAIPRAKINIEIDGFHHHLNPYQALQDLKRTYYSFKKGFFTIRIPNSLIENRLDDAVEYILKFLDESLDYRF
jgi:very-short-patch-repair endonuclease